MLKKTWIVFRKETLDSLRDRRSLGAAFLYSIFGPLVIGLALVSMVKVEERDEPLALAMVGAERAPSLVRYLEEKGAALNDADGDPQGAVRAEHAEIVLVVAEDYAEDFRRSRPAGLQLVYDTSRDESQRAERRLRRLLAGYGADVAELRLFSRGVVPSALDAFDVASVDLATSSSKALRILGIFPMYLLLAAFIGGMNVAIDVTAGERERGSLEALLVNPVPRQALAFGKWLAAVALNVLVVVATLLVSIKVINAERFDLLPIRLEPEQAVVILVFLLPLAFLGPAIQMLVAFFARSYKEAQTYLQLLIFVPMLPGMFLAFDLFEPASWMASLPVVGQQILISDFLQGKVESLASSVVAGGTTLLAALACVVTTGLLLQHERVVLGR